MSRRTRRVAIRIYSESGSVTQQDVQPISLVRRMSQTACREREVQPSAHHDEFPRVPTTKRAEGTAQTFSSPR